MLKVIENLERFVMISLFLMIILAVSIQVFFRYVLNNPLSWPEELARFLLVWLSFIATSILYRRKGHIAIDTLVKLFQARHQLIISILLNTIIMTFLIVIVISGTGLQKYQVSMSTMTNLEIPKCYLTLALTVGAASMTLTAAHLILEDVRGLLDPGR